MELAIAKGWVIAASLLASHNLRGLKEPVAEDLARAVLANPLTPTDAGIRTSLALEVAIAWLEGQNRLDVIGDGGASYCWAQIHLPNGARTLEGWTGAELLSDGLKCATAGVRIMKASVTSPQNPGDCELCVYARGPDWRRKCVHEVDGVQHEEECRAGETPVARRLSEHRVALAKRLIREVPMPVDP